jgi:erythromycin esterase-like protein
MKKLPLIMSLTLIMTQIFGQNKIWTEESRINWLKNNVVEVKSTSPADTNFEDLQSLKGIFKNVNIVMLGESHGEGNIISAKIRMVEFLHGQMGFDILAFEAGFYDFHTFNDSVKSGMRVDSALTYLGHTTTLTTWAGTDEFDPLIKYISESYDKGKKTVSFAGIDCQNAFWSADFKKDIDRNFEGIEPLTKQERKVFYSLIDSVAYYRPFHSAQDSSLYYKNINLYSEASKKMKDKEQGIYWLQVFKNLGSLTASTICYLDNQKKEYIPMADVNNPRDLQMADNLIWLVEHNPGKKIIVWSASNHLSRNLKTVKESDDPVFYTNFHPMGEFIKNKYGDKAYAMGFTAAGGSRFVKGMMKEPQQITAVRNNSIECYMQKAGFNYGILNYRALPKDSFLNDENYSNPFGYATQKLAVWPTVLDGIFFINEVTSPHWK